MIQLLTNKEKNNAKFFEKHRNNMQFEDEKKEDVFVSYVKSVQKAMKRKEQENQ